MQKPIIMPFKGITPTIHADAFIAPGAVIIGDVVIGKDTNIWFGCILRGDVHAIRVGERTNLQDGTIVHVTEGVTGTEIGSDVTVGHMALIHGSTIEDGAFVGMKATTMDKSVVKAGAMLAAGALLTPGKIVPSGELWAGNPAKLFRPMKQEEVDYLPWSAQHYVELSKHYM